LRYSSKGGYLRGSVREAYRISERHACRLLGQWRGTQRYEVLYRTDEDALTRAIVELASEYGRYGYRRITVTLREAGWPVGKDRVQRIWRREGLKVPQKQRPRGRLWLNEGSCIRLRPEKANHVWSYDFVKAMTHDGRSLRLLVLIDEYTRECLTIRVARRLGSCEVIETLADVMLWRGIPEYLRSDNGPEFVARELRKWLGKLGNRNAVHRTRESVGKRLLRKLQREAAGRMLERRDFLFAAGGADGDRAVASGVQHQASTLGPGLQAASTGGVRAPICSSPVAYGSLRAANCTKGFVMYTLSHPLVQKLGLVTAPRGDHGGPKENSAAVV
jgi:transposase InsO family protein